MLVVDDVSGNGRPALSPIAGAFSSGFVGANCYGYRNTVEEGFKRSSFTYSAYFAAAVFREFKPDLAGYSSKLIHKRFSGN